MTRLSLCLFGAPEIEHAGLPVKVTQRKPLALLAYLGVTGTPHTREHLATLFWPDAEQDRALAYLRNALWQLNQTPAGAWVEVDREMVALRQGPDLQLDVVQFERLDTFVKGHGHASHNLCTACVAALVEAVDLYRGDFMAGVTLEDSASFDEWQFFQTEALRQTATEALEKLTDYYEQMPDGDPTRALAYARRWLVFDPQNENAHRALMRLYAMTDQRAAALRQYDTCIRVLKEGLGTTPGKATIDLYHQLRSGHLNVPPRVVPTRDGPPEASKRPMVHLPVSMTPFVGRREELAEVRRLLAQPACRLLSLVGPGGIGKTRLALEAARSIAAEHDSAFIGGIVMVSLASVSTTEAAVHEIAAALGLTSPRQRDERLSLADNRVPPPTVGAGHAPMLRQMVIDYLQHQRHSLLLILDNIEHLLNASARKGDDGAPANPSEGIAGLIETVLQTAPAVRLLVTTRQRLNLLTEWVFGVTGMGLPSGNGVDLAESGAIQLFIQSAERAMVGFEPSPDELNSIARICRLVEGFPLAIELAASWVRFLPCQEIAEEVRASFDFLSSSLRDVPERHRSLRTIFEHSWTLLPQQEAEAFARLAIFPGSFTREAAREVTGSSLLILSALIDKSLLQQITSEREPPDRDGPASEDRPLPENRPHSGRYGMHTVLRQYAEAKLRLMPGVFEEMGRRHAHYYLSLVAGMEPALKGGDQRLALDTIGTERANVRAAWLWATEHLDVAELRRALAPVHQFCVARGQVQTGAELFRTTVEILDAREAETVDSNDRNALLGLLLVLLELYSGTSASSPTESTAARGLELLEALGPSDELALATLVWIATNRVPDRQEARNRLHEVLGFFEQRDNLRGRAETLHLLGAVAADRHDDYLEGETYLEQGLRLHREIKDSAGAAEDLLLLGLIADSRGISELAEQRYRDALRIYRDLGDPSRLSTCLFRLGDLARRNGDFAVSRTWLEEALSIARTMGNGRFVASALNYLWILAYDARSYTEAQQIAEEEVAIWRGIGVINGVAEAQQRLADTHVALGDYDLARHYLKTSLAAVPNNAWALLGLAHVTELEGDVAGAFSIYCQAIQLAHRASALSTFPIIPVMLKGMIGLSRLYVQQGKPERAAELLGLVLYQPTLHDAMRTEAEKLLVDLLARHPDEAVEAARLRGATLDLETVAMQITQDIASF
jgi:DNA-binding SARP family transcriptional activator/predicted ATPase/tetratricopeptide (TPR) repeat protein